MIDMDKKYKTKNDESVIIYSANGRGNYSIHGAILRNDGWQAVEWTIKGICKYGVHSFDLVEVKPFTPKAENAALAAQPTERKAGEPNMWPEFSASMKADISAGFFREKERLHVERSTIERATIARCVKAMEKYIRDSREDASDILYELPGFIRALPLASDIK